MSVKKHKPKKSSAKSVKKDIADAVNKIPSMISEEMQKDEATAEHKPILQRSRTDDKKTDDKKTHAHHFIYDHHHILSKKRLLWWGVICLMLIVAAMWVWNIRVFLYKFQINQTQQTEPGLLGNLKDDFQDVLDAISQKEAEKEATRAQVEKQVKAAEDAQKVEQGLQEILKETTQKESAQNAKNKTQ